MSSKPVRTILTIVMDLLIVVAIALTLRLTVEFFGQLAAQSWAKTVIALTNPLVLPLGIDAIKTPYGGIFDVNAAVTIIILLVIEWVLSMIRARD